jgi:hypothetical protein
MIAIQPRFLALLALCAAAVAAPSEEVGATRRSTLAVADPRPCRMLAAPPTSLSPSTSRAPPVSPLVFPPVSPLVSLPPASLPPLATF